MQKSLLLPVVIVLFAAAPCAAQEQSSGTVALSTLKRDRAFGRQLIQEMEEHSMAERKAESEFMSTLSGKSTESRAKAMAKFKKKQAAEKKKFRRQMHEKMADYQAKKHKESVSNMRAKLAENKQMTEDEKATYMARMETRYKSGKEYNNKLFEEKEKLLDALDKPNLDEAQEAALRKEYDVKTRVLQEEYQKKSAEEEEEFRKKALAE
ncbi:MAG: hypothetical protein GX410_05285 [Elusimicrobia bacterium]|nr:hypothetical protein [Elusimicrobiota bacterium]